MEDLTKAEPALLLADATIEQLLDELDARHTAMVFAGYEFGNAESQVRAFLGGDSALAKTGLIGVLQFSASEEVRKCLVGYRSNPR